MDKQATVCVYERINRCKMPYALTARFLVILRETGRHHVVTELRRHEACTMRQCRLRSCRHMLLTHWALSPSDSRACIVCTFLAE